MARTAAATLRTLCGLLGPAAFTAAWVIGTRRQPGYAVAHEHISGLAAPDAAHPRVMQAGFVVLGCSAIAFAAELDARVSSSDRPSGLGPALLGVSGVATVIAGIATRDRMSNTVPDGVPPRQSARNDLHDVASVISGATGTLGLLALARRFRGDRTWDGMARGAVTTAVSGIALSGVFLRDVTRPGNGIVQRAGVSLPLGFMARTALRMLRTA